MSYCGVLVKGRDGNGVVALRGVDAPCSIAVGQHVFESVGGSAVLGFRDMSSPSCGH